MATAFVRLQININSVLNWINAFGTNGRQVVGGSIKINGGHIHPQWVDKGTPSPKAPAEIEFLIVLQGLMERG